MSIGAGPDTALRSLGDEGRSGCREPYLEPETVSAGRAEQPGVRTRAGQGHGPERWSTGGGGSQEPRGRGPQPGAHSSGRAKQRQEPGHGAPRSVPTQEPAPAQSGGRGRGLELHLLPGPASTSPGSSPGAELSVGWAGLYGRALVFWAPPNSSALCRSSLSLSGRGVWRRALSLVPAPRPSFPG